MANITVKFSGENEGSISVNGQTTSFWHCDNFEYPYSFWNLSLLRLTLSQACNAIKLAKNL